MSVKIIEAGAPRETYPCFRMQPITLRNDGKQAVLVLTAKPLDSVKRQCFWLMPGATLVVFAEPEIIDPADIEEIKPPHG